MGSSHKIFHAKSKTFVKRKANALAMREWYSNAMRQSEHRFGGHLDKTMDVMII